MEFSDIKGKTFTSITVNGDEDQILFIDSEGVNYCMLHHQD